jgi:sulfite reductase alpha subunit-like flavoprotein
MRSNYSFPLHSLDTFIHQVQLGAKPICHIGYGDDGSLNGGVFADLDVWLVKELFPVMRTRFQMGHNDVVHAMHEDNSGEDDHSPFEVTVLQSSNGSNSDERNGVGEWEKADYRQHYCNYFTHRHPTTSYQYNDQLVRMHQPNEHTNNSPLLGRVTVNRRITSNDWMQDTRHIRIHVVGSMHSDQSSVSSPSPSSIVNAHTLPYQAGDVATILPSNPPSLVERFLTVLPIPIRTMADDILRIRHDPHRRSRTAVNPSWPEVCTLRGLLTHCADIQSLPEREDLFALSAYCNLNHPEGREHRDKLIALSETAGASLYGDYIIREKRNWVDLFYDFDSIRWKRNDNNKEERNDGEGSLLTISHLLALLPSISPRHFSIASSPSFLKHESSLSKRAIGFELELCVAVVEGTTPLGRSYAGCCSKFLSSIVPDQAEIENGSDLLCLWIHPGSFSALPLTLAAYTKQEDYARNRYFETPVMCIGAGTGIAPLRSLIFEREYQILSKAKDSYQFPPNGNDSKLGDSDNILVFGCRTQSDDYYYGDEWESLTSSKRLRLIQAFSREQEHKLYVQRALKEADGGELIANHILDRRGAVYIAGGSKMARAVKDEIVAALGNRCDGGEKDAKRLLNKLKRAGLFSIEAWS